MIQKIQEAVAKELEKCATWGRTTAPMTKQHQTLSQQDKSTSSPEPATKIADRENTQNEEVWKTTTRAPRMTTNQETGRQQQGAPTETETTPTTLTQRNTRDQEPCSAFTDDSHKTTTQNTENNHRRDKAEDSQTTTATERKENAENEPRETGPDFNESESGEPFTEVIRKRRQHRPRIIGTMTESSDLKTGNRRAWIYVGKLHETATAEKLKAHLHKKGITGEIECEELNILGHLKAFKIGIPFESLDEANKAEFWPSGVLVRQYIFRRKRQQGATL
ncbi:hypothetical protein ANN_02274 [Periplaneta americana]|uniref:Uncharacterized protein n=1 Tax=Periplaneta americana TaxID=6978 RepID=A0ABQ8TYB2_PERAM|nr:hypothetical protein ANN_02274 [Periplaneta americana]